MMKNSMGGSLKFFFKQNYLMIQLSQFWVLLLGINLKRKKKQLEKIYAHTSTQKCV